MFNIRDTARRVVPWVAAFATVAVVGVGLRSAPQAEKARAIPAPTVDETSAAASEVAVLAGGCFWGVQGVYQHVKGVTSALSGYAGGQQSTCPLRDDRARWNRACGISAGHIRSA